MAKFKAEELKSTIGKCTRFSTTRGLIPEYGYLAMREGGHIFATNGVTGIRHQNPVTSLIEEFVLPSETFFGILSSFPADTEVDLIKQDKYTFVKVGRSFRAKFPNLQEESINMDIPPDEVKIPLPDGFGECLRQIVFSVPKDDKVKESLRGIYYDGKSFYASDNIKLSRITPNFTLGEELFIPNQLLEHLVEDKPLAYCITEAEGVERLLWFWFKDYIIFGAVKGTVFPMGEGNFDKILVEECNSTHISAKPEELKENVDRIAIIAEQYRNRINIVAFKDDLALYTVIPSGIEAIEFFPVSSDVKEGEKPEFVAVDINFFKEEIERCSDFFFTDDFIYFRNKDGLESILKPLGVEDGAAIMEKVGEYYNNRSESGATELDRDSGETSSQAQ